MDNGGLTKIISYFAYVFGTFRWVMFNGRGLFQQAILELANKQLFT